VTVPMAWDAVPLGELCDVRIGKTPRRAEPKYWGGDYPWLSISDMNQGRWLAETKEGITRLAVEEQNCRLVPEGTVLLSFKLSIGKVGIAARPLYTNEAIAQLPLVDSRVSRDFLYWALKTVPLTAEADLAAKGATLNKAKIRRLSIPVPTPDEQVHIVRVLNDAELLLSTQRRAAEVAEQYVSAVQAQAFRGEL
jgi:type I restriction enzyme, S subunit